MKTDLDTIMQEGKVDALLVVGPAGHNPAMTYFTGQAHVHGLLLKKRQQAPVLFHGSIERDEAAGTGLETRSLDDFDYVKLLKDAEGDSTLATAVLLQKILTEYQVEGRVAIYGRTEIGPYFASFKKLQQMLPQVELIGEIDRLSVLTRARTTKSEDEIERMRRIGETTAAVFGEVATFLTSHQVKDGMLVNGQGDPLRVGDVKRRISLWLAIRGAENPEGTIFSIGRDAGVPHSAGKDEDLIEIGKPIVFDLFPCEAGGGYFHDLTRTWSLGHASDELLQVYEDVLQVYQAAVSGLEAGSLCRDHQIRTCKLFEERGHATLLNNPKTQEGYVHSLGHGVGLAVHEGPTFSHLESNHDRLLPGSVITIEPGLYYPERQIGVRIEDTVWVRPDGGIQSLAEFPKDLVLKIPGG